MQFSGMDPYLDIEFLFVRFLSRETTESENQRLYTWLQESPEHQLLFEQYKKAWDFAGECDPNVTFDPEQDREEVWTQIRNSQIRRLHRRIWRVAGAAVAVVLLFVWVVRPPVMTPEAVRAEMTQITIPNGEMKQLILSDGSRIWLNAGSSLSYGALEGKHIREVYLSGEAYFEIARDTLRPFVVRTRTIDINVLGTKFNVASFDNSAVVQTTVIEGCVSVAPKAAGETDTLQRVRLLKNNQAVYQDETHALLLSEVDASSYICWREGILSFKEERLESILQKLERQFDVKIWVQDTDLNDYTFTATFEKGKTVGEILNVFSQTCPLRYQINGKTITLKSF